MDYQTKRILVLAATAAVMGVVGMAIALRAAARKPPEPMVWPVETRTNFLVSIHQPDSPSVFSGRTNYLGEAVMVSCASCHATTTPNTVLRDASQLKQFHQGMKFNHGELSCVSCHDKNNYDALRLADGTAVEFQKVMQLCAQCHGPQWRDYRNGAHGGMNGFWDLTRGPRQRNACTDCHDPHSPGYPVVMPVFKPRPAERERAPHPEALTNPSKH